MYGRSVIYRRAWLPHERAAEQMRILFVSGQFPQVVSESVYGGFQRMRMWLDAFQGLGAELDILFFPGEGVATDANAARDLKHELLQSWGLRCNVALCERQARPPAGGRISQYIDAYVKPALGPSRHPHFGAFQGRLQREAVARCLARSPDFVFFHRTYVAGLARSQSLANSRVLFDIDDIEHRRFAREVGQPPHWRLKPLLYCQLPALWWGERDAIARADRAFVCSETDRRYLRRTMRVRNLEVIPNAVDHVDARMLPPEPTVLFLGAYTYPPNVVAADYLVSEVWPRLTRTLPPARLLIAGPHPEALQCYRRRPDGVEFLGFVPDLIALYGRTRVVCCPIQSGTGTRIKILEAASFGVPVVSTSVGAEGISLAADTEVVIRNDAAGLAQACATLLSDDAHAHQIGAAGRARVRALYSRDAVVKRMRSILEAIRGRAS